MPSDSLQQARATRTDCDRTSPTTAILLTNSRQKFWISFVVSHSDSRPAVIFDRTAFYPTSGGQVFDMGWILPAETGDQQQPIARRRGDGKNDGTILHILESGGTDPERHPYSRSDRR